MVHFNVYVLAIVAFATYISAEDDYFVDYCTCVNDVETYKSKYEALYKSYYDESNPELAKAHDSISERMGGIKKSNPCKLSTNPDDYIKDVMTLCGYNRLASCYKPFWEKEEKSAEEVCKFLTVKMPSLEAQKRSTLTVIKNCDYMSLFDKSVKTLFDGCGNCKAE